MHFYKQIESGQIPQSCLYFQDFQSSKLLNGCLYINKINKGIPYNAEPDRDADLQKRRTPGLYKKWTLCQNSLYELKTDF